MIVDASSTKRSAEKKKDEAGTAIAMEVLTA
jgi:hypothetical protein